MENSLLLSISLNTDILETNIINIVILVAILFNVVGGALKDAMIERKEKNNLSVIYLTSGKCLHCTEEAASTKLPVA